DQYQQKHAANAPDLHQVRIGAAVEGVADPIDDDPYDQREAAQDLVENQPPVLANDDVAQAKDDKPADRPAPDVQLMQHRHGEPAGQRRIVHHHFAGDPAE